ncbi:MAG: multidrug effflux MFS transporter [Pseudomonadota bacterium]
MATIAFSVDAMLPAMPEIAVALSPDAPNRAQLIVTSFIIGLGLGTFIVGPLSDAYGRKPVVAVGSAIYILGAALAWQAPSLEVLLVGRVIQGIGGSAARVVSIAIIRDLYTGRRMAQMMSLVLMIFALFPAVAPAMGAGIIHVAGWRSIFLAFLGFGVISAAWFLLRQEETHPPEARRPFRQSIIRSGIGEISRDPDVLRVICALTLNFGMLFSLLSSIQPIMDVTFDRADSFHWWFMMIAVIAASASILNARIVMRLGMRRVAIGALALCMTTSAMLMAYGALGNWTHPAAFPLFMIWGTSIFWSMGLTIGNLNALAMAPLGHIAGLAASLVGAVSTVASMLIAIPVGQMFNGTPMPTALGVFTCALLGFVITRSVGEPSPDPQESNP